MATCSSAGTGHGGVCVRRDGISAMPGLCAVSSTTIPNVHNPSVGSVLHTHRCLSDAAVEVLAVSSEAPVFVGRVNCTGSERWLNGCRHDSPPTGGCTAAAVSCGRSSSEDTHTTHTHTHTHLTTHTVMCSPCGNYFSDCSLLQVSQGVQCQLGLPPK